MEKANYPFFQLPVLNISPDLKNLQLMDKHFIKKRIRWLLAGAFLCIVYLMWATFSNMNQANDEAVTVRASLNRLLHLENILVHVHALETGQRGFVISGDENFLDPYYKSLGDLKRDTVKLAALQLPSKQYEANARQLFTFLRSKLDVCAAIIEARRISGYDSAKSLIETKSGKQLTDSVIQYVGVLQQVDRSLLDSANAQRTKIAGQTTWQLLLLALCFLAIILITYYIINKDFKQIVEAEKQLKFNASIIRNISDPIITTDIFHKITNWNIYAEELYGYKESEVLGKEIRSVLELLKESTNGSLPSMLPEGKDFWKGELTHFHKNGNKLFTEVTTSAIRDEESGERQGFVSVIRNITARKDTEEKLQRLTTHLEDEVKLKAAELNNIFERITDAFIALDNEWRYTYVNQKAAELHNKPIEELLGKNMLEEYPEVAEGPFYKALLDAKATNTASRVQLYHPPTDKWFEDLIYPSPDGISVYYHDITDAKKAELSLLKTHEKLTYHINNTPMGVVEFDKELNVIQWSDRAAEIFGWTKAELSKIGASVMQDLVLEEDRAIIENEIVDFFGSKGDRGFLAVRNKTKSGRTIFCEWYTSALKNETGEVTGLMSLVHDVTKRKEVQTELEEAEVKFRSLVEQSMVGVYIVQADKFIYINPRLREITGYTEPGIEQRIGLLDVIHPDDVAMVTKNLALRFAGGKQSINYELRFIRKNGEVGFAEVFGTLTQYMGQPAIIGTLIDVTERKDSMKRIQESQQALAASNERFHLVAKATNDAVWDWSIETNRVWGNELFSRYFDVEVGAEVSYEQFLDRVHPDNREVLKINLQKAITNKQAIIIEDFLFRLSDGSYINIYDRANIIYDDQGNASRMLGAMQDITALKKNEQQISLEKELSDSIINSLPGVFYLYNKQGVFYRWNTNFELISGYNAEEIKRMVPTDFFVGDEKKLMAEKIASVFRIGEDFVEASLLSKDGTKTPYYFTGRRIYLEGEACLMGIGIDISEKVKSQEQLAQSEERYRTIIEQASDGIFISDLEGNYLDVNPNGEQLTGYTKAEILNMTIYDLMPPGDKTVNPPKLKELFEVGAAINERVFKTKDGTLKEVEISAKLLGDGRLLGLVRDITTRKRNEEILRASEEKYRFLFNQNPMPMWMISEPEKKFLDVNNAAIEFYGYSKAEFLNMTAYDIRPAEAKQALKDYAAHSARQGVVHAGVWDHIKKDGTLIKVNIITHDIYFEGSDAKLVLANDVTQKILAEEALNKSHMELRDLATHLEAVRETERTNIAREIHDELGQQLTGLKMDMSWINKRLTSQDEAVRQKIKETIELVDETVKSVRRIATELRPSILDDLGLLAAMEWQSDEFEKRSEISCTFSSNVSEINLSPAIATSVFRIYQECLTNVLRHAAATQVNSFLQVKDSILVLTISDNGKGFIESEIALKRTLGILGMKERALLLGGTYEITSRPGKGTSVLIIIPLKN